MHEAVGLRERKKTETRQALAEAALALAVERGPAAITVDDIAAAAGVSTRTVFNYFGTKEEAILGVDPERRRDMLARLDDRPPDEPPLVALQEAMRDSTGTGVNAVAWRTRARLARQHQHLQAAYVASFSQLEDDLTTAIARRIGVDPKRDPFPRLVVAIALTAMRVAVDHAIDRRQAGASLRAIDDAFAALASGLEVPR